MADLGRYFSKDRRTSFNLGRTINHGHDGIVCEISGSYMVVAKLLTDFVDGDISTPGSREHMEAKLAYMLTLGVSPVLGTGNNRRLCIAWPGQLLYDESGLFSGYTMPRVTPDAGDTELRSITTALRPRERNELFRAPNGSPTYSFEHALRIALNLTIVVKYLHDNNVVIGDFNPNNLMLSRDCHVTVVDASSFDIEAKRFGLHFPCLVGRPELLAPELQHANRYGMDGHRFSKESDRFSLAIYIFKLLSDGYHPFCDASNRTEWENIISGSCAYVSNATAKPQLHGPDMSKYPSYIRTLFDRTFGYNSKNALWPSTRLRRATADEWIEALNRLKAERRQGMSAPRPRSVTPQTNVTRTSAGQRETGSDEMVFAIILVLMVLLAIFALYMRNGQGI